MRSITQLREERELPVCIILTVFALHMHGCSYLMFTFVDPRWEYLLVVVTISLPKVFAWSTPRR